MPINNADKNVKMYACKKATNNSNKLSAAEPTTTTIVCVPPGGEPWVAADELRFPNGLALRADDSMLVLADVYRRRSAGYKAGAALAVLGAAVIACAMVVLWTRSYR